MATYAKGFKKTQPDQILLKAIVAMILVVLLAVGAAYIYDLATDIGDYTDFTDQHIKTYDAILTQKDDATVQLQNYIVYFYNETDEDCVDIQKRVLKYAEKINADSEVIFFVNLEDLTATESTDDDDFLLAIGQGNAWLNKAPMLISVADGVFNAQYTGADAVLAVLEQVDAGEYTPFN
jgi:hypothetical protein